MKRNLIFILALLIISSALGCSKEEVITEENESREEVTDAAELQTEEVTTEAIPQTDEVTTKAVPQTEKVTEKATEAKKETERVTERVEPNIVKPITQSYIEVSEYKGDLNSVEKYTVSTSEYAVAVAFKAEGDIYDLRICGIEMTYGYDELTETVLEGIDISDGKRIVVMLDFPGDMSSWYYSYTNNVGKTFENQIYISGMDGSVVSTQWQ